MHGMRQEIPSKIMTRRQERKLLYVAPLIFFGVPCLLWFIVFRTTVRSSSIPQPPAVIQSIPVSPSPETDDQQVVYPLVADGNIPAFLVESPGTAIRFSELIKEDQGQAKWMMRGGNGFEWAGDATVVRVLQRYGPDGILVQVVQSDKPELVGRAMYSSPDFLGTAIHSPVKEGDGEAQQWD